MDLSASSAPGRLVVRRRTIEDGLSEEIRFHLEQQIAKNIRAGMSPVEARRHAFVRLEESNR